MSSYERNNLGYFFEALAFAKKPRLAMEIGVLDGYSARRIEKHSEKFIIWDLFEKFEYNHANREQVQGLFPSALIEQVNYYSPHHIENGSIDLLHIDIANTGDTYRFFLEHYYEKLSPTGIAILEGGSEERDGYWWMKAFNKAPICDALIEFKEKGIDFQVIDIWPSLTIVRKHEVAHHNV